MGSPAAKGSDPSPAAQPQIDERADEQREIARGGIDSTHLDQDRDNQTPTENASSESNEGTRRSRKESDRRREKAIADGDIDETGLEGDPGHQTPTGNR